MSTPLTQTAASEMDLVELVDADLGSWALHRDCKTSAGVLDPYEDGGLPDGWVAWSRFADFMVGSDLVLIRRRIGDWVVLHHDRDTGNSRVTRGASTFMKLYENMIDPDDRESAGGPPESLSRRVRRSVRRQQWLRRVALRCFDSGEPVEAAEQMMVALGGPLTVPSAVLA